MNLAVFFALATLYQNSQIDWFATIITIITIIAFIAFIALFYFKIGIMSVIAAGSILGLSVSFF